MVEPTTRNRFSEQGTQSQRGEQLVRVVPTSQPRVPLGRGETSKNPTQEKWGVGAGVENNNKRHLGGSSPARQVGRVAPSVTTGGRLSGKGGPGNGPGSRKTPERTCSFCSTPHPPTEGPLPSIPSVRTQTYPNTYGTAPKFRVQTRGGHPRSGIGVGGSSTP